MRLYGDLARYWQLVSAVEDYADEAVLYRDLLHAHAVPRPTTLLELGAGGGNNAFFLKRDFAVVLTDLSPQMLDQSRRINPECEHVVGDMRCLRLGRTFDAVLVHDAVVYMTTRADLHATMATAFAHLRPGGAALFAPDRCRRRSLHRRKCTAASPPMARRCAISSGATPPSPAPRRS